MLFKFHKYLYIICLRQPWAPCVTDGIVYHNLQFTSPNEIFIPNIIPIAVWPVLQPVGSQARFYGPSEWQSFQSVGSIFNLPDICVWLSVNVYCRSSLLLIKCSSLFNRCFCICLTSNVSRLKFAKKIAKGIYTYKSILQYIYI